jgi:hypothetical protein
MSERGERIIGRSRLVPLCLISLAAPDRRESAA